MGGPSWITILDLTYKKETKLQEWRYKVEKEVSLDCFPVSVIILQKDASKIATKKQNKKKTITQDGCL